MSDLDRVAAALPAYEVFGELGRGAWGIVYEGRHRQLERRVAIKQLTEAFASSEQTRARFVAEARLLAALDHPYIVPVYDYVEEEGLCLLIMEKLDGGTVWNRFTTSGLGPEAACGVVMAACAALERAHEKGVLHRDVKPENLMFSGTDTIKVTDFGIAKIVGGSLTLATAAGEVLGTPAYIAPEQAQGKEVGPYTDVYATGTMLYELLSGQLPFPEADDALTLLYQHVFEDPVDLREVSPHIPPELAQVTMRALARTPSDRYGAAEEFGMEVAAAATAAWGTGWVGRTGIALHAAGRILVAAETEPASRSPTATVAARAAPSERVRSSSSPNVRAPTAPLPVQDLVPVQQVITVPAPPVPQLATSLALLLLLLALALVGLGSPSRSGLRGPTALRVAGADPTADRAIDLDFSAPVSVSGAPPAEAAEADEVRLSFSVAGVPLGSASAKATLVGGELMSSVDAGGSAYLVAGRATGKLALLRSGRELLQREFSVKSRQSRFLTVPAAVGLALLLFAVAYVESLLRSLRRGRNRVAAYPGAVIFGAVGGLALAVCVWVAAGREPTRLTLLACALLGAGSAVAAALASSRLGRRRRARRKSAAAT